MDGLTRCDQIGAERLERDAQSWIVHARGKAHTARSVIIASGGERSP
ncbi:hypothetical protein [uncultured Novosphingobium sp.]|nr:hypothetical protein [uncultured Novosphingobium sp.]